MSVGEPVLVVAYDGGGVLRTTGVLVEASAGTPTQVAASRVLGMADTIPAPATGKVVVVRRGPPSSIAVFQHVAGNAVPAWCGNITGAGLVALGAQRAVLHGPDGATATVEIASASAVLAQRWQFKIAGGVRPPARVHEAVPIWSSSTLNDYRIRLGRITDVVDVAPPSPMTKTAIIEAGDPHPKVRFHTGQRWHGAAPLTGLVELVVAAGSESSIAAAMGISSHVVLPDGRLEPLPGVVVDADTITVDFAPRRYVLIAVGVDTGPHVPAPASLRQGS
jgi:hypothetical protein